MREYWIALNNITGLGPVRIERLLNAFGTPRAALDAPPLMLADKKLIAQSSVADFRRKDELLDAAHRQIEECRRAGVSILTRGDDEYPLYLKEIFAPPPVLYVKGDVSVLGRHAIAIVGTRNPTSYGVQCARMLAGDLSASVVVASGLARGIDTAAHERCVETGGKTVAVMGCGIDRVYPPENKGLAERICKSGAIVSEFPPGTVPESHNFPRRNRIISGLSCGVIVVEAGEKSGALITADYALEQNRSVFAVPGPITSPVSGGTFRLIKDGAIPIRSAADVFEHISAVTFDPLLSARPNAIGREQMPSLAEDEQAVWDALSNTPERVDTIAESCGLEIPQILGILLTLELNGFIAQVGGQQFKRVL